MMLETKVYFDVKEPPFCRVFVRTFVEGALKWTVSFGRTTFKRNLFRRKLLPRRDRSWSGEKG